MTPVSTSAAAPLAATSATASSASNSLTSLSQNFGNFLNLLMTQLKNQDPSSPMDANSFTTELVQFSSVEQQINTNASLNTLIQLTQAGDVSQATAVVGKQVMVQSTQMALQNGSGTLVFTAAAAEPATITVKNAAGSTLQQVAVKASQGENAWTWDGAASSGRTLPDGAYTVTVTSGAPGVSATALPFTVVGTATGVSAANNVVNLQIGALSVPFSDVVSVGSRS
jgi:flagellar basal-body rod modification protein FlgD